MVETIPAEQEPGPPARLVPPIHPASTFAPLPVPLTDYVERPREAAALLDLLRPGGPRLVTLTGPGGAGKTRLALRVAADLAPRFPDGVAFIPLASVADADLVASTVATALGVRQTGDQPVRHLLSIALCTRELLLVLDNFEHLLPAAVLVTELLTACPKLTVLVTSRTTLRLSGEHVFPVSTMALPPPDGSVTTTIARQSEAVQLFEARARAAMPSFTLSDDNAANVTEVCRRLDGLPLAIELAAARIPVLPPHALLARLDRRLPLLTGGPRDAPERLRTVRGAIARSHDLLSPAEQTLFRRLAVFAGGCTLDAAESAVGDGDLDVLDGISGLVDASLLQQHSVGETPRYLMLETVREYGLEQLSKSVEEATVRSAHAAWCLALAERAEPFWYSPEEARWAVRLEAEHDNLRAALAWLAEREDIETCLRLIAAMSTFWEFRGAWAEGRIWLKRALAWSAGHRTRYRVRILNEAAGMAERSASRHTDPPQVEAWAAEALGIARELGDAPGETFSLVRLAQAAWLEADYERATSFYEAALALVPDLNDTIASPASVESFLLTYLGLVALKQGDYARATSLAENALARQRTIGFTWAAADSLIVLAVLAHDRGDVVQATALCQEGLRVAWPQSYQYQFVVLIDRLAMLAGEAGQAEHAARLGGTVERLHEQFDTLPNISEQALRDRAREAARGRLGDDAFTAAWTEGRTLSLDQAVTLAAEIAVIPDNIPATTPPDAAIRYGLTPREMEVLRFVAVGHSNRAIADTLSLSERTIESHVLHIMTKLGVESRTAAAIYAVRQGLA